MDGEHSGPNVSKSNASDVVRWRQAYADWIAPKTRRSPRPAVEPGPGFVYFVEDVAAKAIKVGHATNVSRRMSGLRTGNVSLALIGSVRGGRDLEAALHHRFRHHHRAGEWFDAVPAILDEIDDLLAAEHGVSAKLRRHSRGVPLVGLEEIARQNGD